MSIYKAFALAGASVLVLAVSSPAQCAERQTHEAVQSRDPDPVAGEIVVTARRREERLQDIPQSLNVVTAEAIGKLKLTQFSDLQTVVPGLTLTQDGSGTQTASSMRGVTFDVRSTAPPTVAMYLNDAPVQSLFLFDSLFDVGQIEVLRGPQGTTRGVSAPSGAITVTTRKAEPSAAGGYVQGQVTDHDGRNLQGGLNVPLIQEVLAARLSGVIDQTDAGGVRSLHNSRDQRQRTEAGRLSLKFRPSDTVSADLAYTHIDTSLRGYDQVSGPGRGTAVNPALEPEDRRSVQDAISNVKVKLDVVTGRLDASLLGHQLTYVGSYQKARTFALQDADVGDVLPGAALSALTTSWKEETTHEIRLSSEPSAGRLIDYTVGVFNDEADTFARLQTPGPLLPGAFGTPAGTPSVAAFDPRYQIPIVADIPYRSEETSIFAGATLHLGDSTEVSGGVRHIWSKFQSRLGTRLETGLVAIPPAFIGPGLPSCAAAQFQSTYPGFCDVPVPGFALPDANFRATKEPTIYNLSVQHRINDDFMVYAATGTSYRPAIASPGIQGALNGHPDPVLNTLTFHPAETSTNYEAGFKWTLAGGRGRLNASVFRQKFDNLTMFVPNIVYFNTATGQPALGNFTASVDALVTGFEVDAAIRVHGVDLSGQVSYADGEVDGSEVPCNLNQGGEPVFNRAGLISLCPGGSVSRDPLWSATFQAEYARQISGDMDAFVRGLMTYYAKSENRMEPNFTVEDYALVNLYAGLRSEDGAWEVSAFARNLFGVDRTLDRSPVAYDANGSLGQSFAQLIPAGGSGYFGTLVTPRREVGVSVRYAWGSR
jgi:iron complex outermembrane receptor protein